MNSTLAAPTTLSGKTNYNGFRFEREELAFFKKHIWSVWSVANQRLAEKLRTAFADLSMNPALKVVYEVDFSDKYTETISISAGTDNDIFKASITNARFYGGTPYTRMQEIPPVSTAFEMGNRGKKYGADDEVDFESISYKLRQLLVDLRYAVGYTANWFKLEGKDGHPDRSYLQLTFRPIESGLEADTGEVDDFHIVLEIQGAHNPAAEVPGA